MFDKNKKKLYKKNNVFLRPWGKYINLYKGKNFLIKELSIKPKGVLSLQKHNYRSEHWLVTKGNPIIVLNNNQFKKKPTDHIYVPAKSIHRIKNFGNKTVKILEAQIGSQLRESDIVRFEDIYKRVN